MKTIVFHSLAEQELTDAVTFYEEQGLGLGTEYLDVVEQSLDLLKRYPEAGLKIRESVRRLVLPRFPFSLLYRVLDSQIRILAVAHNKRRPYYWIDRE